MVLTVRLFVALQKGFVGAKKAAAPQQRGTLKEAGAPKTC